MPFFLKVGWPISLSVDSYSNYYWGIGIKNMGSKKTSFSYTVLQAEHSRAIFISLHFVLPWLNSTQMNLSPTGITQSQQDTKDLPQELDGSVEDHTGSQLKTVQHSLYHGDPLSLLLFCISLNPLGQIITRDVYPDKECKLWYKSKTQFCKP